MAEEYETVRTIYMDAANVPVNLTTSRLGVSIGRWDGDVVEVETNKVDWPFFDRIGSPQSTAVKTLERFSLSEDKRRLNYNISINHEFFNN